MKILVTIPVAPPGIQNADRADTLQVALKSVADQIGIEEHIVEVQIEVGENGPSIARNRAAARSDSELIAFLDDDDYWYPQYLARALQAIGNTDVVITNFHKEPKGVVVSDSDMKSMLLSGGAITPGSGLIVTRAAFDSVGGFDESICGSDVYDFCLRLALSGATFTNQPIPSWHRTRGRSDHAGRTKTGHEVYKERLALVSRRTKEFS